MVFIGEVRASTNPLNVGVIRSRNEFLQICRAASASVGVNKFTLNVGFPCFFSSHLQVSNQVFPAVCKTKFLLSTIKVTFRVKRP